MNEPWSIQLFGGLRVRQSERVITRFRTQKTGGLLAYLAYHRQHSHARDVLGEIFWPDTTPEVGRHNLSHALSSLRSQLEPPGVPAGTVIIADRYSVELNPDAATTDVAEFEQALRSAAQARNTPEQLPLLMQALEKYTGALLPNYYEDWIAPEQERLAQRFQQAAAQAMALLERAGDLEGTLELARRAVSLDPVREDANRELIRLLMATGQMEAALRQYREYERVLDQEVGEAPGTTLRQFSQHIEAQLAQSRPTLDLRAVATFPPPAPAAPAPSALPTGTVSFLMTDIEGSTILLEKAGDAFRSALSSHHALLRREFRRNGGQEVKEAGDSFLVVFSSVGDAMTCAIACQRSLDTQPWPEAVGRLVVRMAVHTGDVELDAGEYHGPMLHHAARMLSVAHGGQILVSEASAGLLKRDLDPQVRLKDLGVWRLRDVEEPERLFMAVYPQMAREEFAPLNASPAHRAHLPLQFTRFFGREQEIARIGELLAIPETRLLTLTGSGGTGKTRLAVEAVGRFSETFTGAIWFVSLADLSDPNLIPQTLLQAMNLPLIGSQEPLEQAVMALTKQPALLLLDNFEQLVAGGAEIVQTLLSRAPTLQCVVTSRQTLSLPGEVEFAVTPLLTPNGSDTPERLSAFESVRLFVDRAQAAKPDLRITNSNAPAVAELCDRLEGIPLAIELAAARALVLTPSQMLAQLGNRFEFLVSRKRGIAERQRTLRAAVDWSYRLLAPDLQRFFAQLFVFRGGWTVEAAEAVCEEPLALDMLAQLRECSLVTTQESESRIRFRMLESLREYAEEQLSEEERADVQRRHADYFLATAENRSQVMWQTRMETEHGNMQAALRWLQTADGGAQPGLRLASALLWFWAHRGHWGEGRNWFEAVLAKQGAEGRTLARANALHGAGKIACFQADYAQARAYYEESLTILQVFGDRLRTDYVLHGLGEVAYYVGDVALARSLFAQGLAIRREKDDRWAIFSSLYGLGLVASVETDLALARSYFEESLTILQVFGDRDRTAPLLNALGDVAYYLGDYVRAQPYFEDSLAISRESGNQYFTACALNRLGMVACAQGDYVRARSYQEESLTIQQEVGDRRGIAHSMHCLGIVAFREGDFALARSMFVTAFAIRQETGDRITIAYALKTSADLAAAQGEMEIAARLWGAMANLREATGSPLPPNEREEFDRRVAESQAALGETAFAAAWEAGRAMTWEQAVAYALEEGGG